MKKVLFIAALVTLASCSNETASNSTDTTFMITFQRPFPKRVGFTWARPGLSGQVLFLSLPLDVIIESTWDLISYRHFLVFITMSHKFTIPLKPLK